MPKFEALNKSYNAIWVVSDLFSLVHYKLYLTCGSDPDGFKKFRDLMQKNKFVGPTYNIKHSHRMCLNTKSDILRTLQGIP